MPDQAVITVINVCVCLSFQAQQMLSACQEKIDVSNTEGYELFITQLKEGLKNTSHETAANHKVAKVSLKAFAFVLLHPV